MAMAAPTLKAAFSGPSMLSALRIPNFGLRRFALPFLPSATLAVPAAFQLGVPSIPSLLQDIWEGILKAAVPKKKTSHMKKRHRQMAGKALKDVTSLCKCPACGGIKRMHYLCPHCAARKHMAWDLELLFEC